jgi:hypothetical protein
MRSADLTLGARGGNPPCRFARAAWLLAALATALAATPAVACPPPPPPEPSVEQRAARFWRDATEICVVRLAGDSRRVSDLPVLRGYMLAEAFWQIEAVTLQAIKGRCVPGIVHFAEVPYAVCGGGMPTVDADLVVAMTEQRVLIRWVLPASELGAAVARHAETTAR